MEGVDDGRKGFGPVSGTMEYGNQRLASAADSGTDAPGTEAVACSLAAGLGLDGIGDDGGAGMGSPHYWPVDVDLR